MSDIDLKDLSTVKVDQILGDSDPLSPGGVEDELARKMSSLGRVPEKVENLGEVGGDRSGEFGVLGLIVTEEGPICKVGVDNGGEATKGESPALKPTLGDPIPSGTLFSNWIESYREVCGFEALKPYSSG